MTTETAVVAGPGAGSPAPAPAAALWAADGGRRATVRVVLPLLTVAAAAWFATARAGDQMMMSAPAFVAAWTLMMVAMMLPATAPVVALYAVAARRGVVAAVPVFVAGYLCVWALTGLPAYAVSRAVEEPLMDGAPWVARVVGLTLVGAAVYELTPLKAACLRRCRSPIGFFLRRTASLTAPRRAFAAGAEHGAYCLGCCWMLMAVLVALGGMQLGWALALAIVISLQKLAPGGAWIAPVVTATAGLLGIALVLSPPLLDTLVRT